MFCQTAGLRFCGLRGCEFGMLPICVVDNDWMLRCGVDSEGVAGTKVWKIVYIPAHVRHKAGIHSYRMANQAGVGTVKISMLWSILSGFRVPIREKCQ